MFSLPRIADHLLRIFSVPHEKKNAPGNLAASVLPAIVLEHMETAAFVTKSVTSR